MDFVCLPPSRFERVELAVLPASDCSNAPVGPVACGKFALMSTCEALGRTSGFAAVVAQFVVPAVPAVLVWELLMALKKVSKWLYNLTGGYQGHTTISPWLLTMRYIK